MAADKIANSFLILFSVAFFVIYGSCAPIEEKIVLENGTVLTMVIHDVEEAPPPRFDSLLDDKSKDEDGPVIVIHEAQHAPPPRVMSKRSIGDVDSNIKIEEPLYPPSPRFENARESATSTPVAVADGAQTTKEVQRQSSFDTGKIESETGKVSDAPKQEIQESNVGESDGDDESEAENDKNGQERSTLIAVPIEPIGKLDENTHLHTDAVDDSRNREDEDKDKDAVDDAGNGEAESKESKEQVRSAPISVTTISSVDRLDSSGSHDGGNTQEDTKADTEKGTDGIVGNDRSAENGVDKGDNAPADESPGHNPPEDSDNELKDKNTVSTPSDEGGESELPSDDPNDQQIGDDANDDDNINNEEDYGDDDDTKNSQNAEENLPFDGTEEDDDPDDADEGLEENDSKGKPPNSGEVNESDGSSTLTKSISESQSSGHFMSYFLIAVVFVACFYLVFHNRQKIKAYVLEGKTGRGRRRKTGGSEYRQLSTTEEVLPSADKGIESKTTYTY